MRRPEPPAVPLVVAPDSFASRRAGWMMDALPMAHLGRGLIPTRALGAAPSMRRLLSGVDLDSLTPEARQLVPHIERVDAMVAEFRWRSSGLVFTHAAGEHNLGQGITKKFVLEGRPTGAHASRPAQFLFKMVRPSTGHKIEALTVLANVVGLATPLARCAEVDLSNLAFSSVEQGALIDWLGDSESILVQRGWNLRRANPEVLTYLFLARWFAEFVGNQENWAGQFLVPRADEARHSEIVQIDFDAAWGSQDPEWLYRILTERWKLCGVRREDCHWTSRRFAFEAPVGWAREHYDAPQSFFGPLLGAYIRREIDVDFSGLIVHLTNLQHLPPQVLENILTPYLRAAADMNDGKVPVRGMDGFITPAAFWEGFKARFYRSLPEYIEFLRLLQTARDEGSSEIGRFYHHMPKVSYNNVDAAGGVEVDDASAAGVAAVVADT